MTSAKAITGGVFGVFSDDLLAVVTWGLHSLGVPETVEAALARIIVGAVGFGVVYLIPNRTR